MDEANHYYTLELISKPDEIPACWGRYNDAHVEILKDTSGVIQSLIENEGQNFVYVKDLKK